MKRTAKIEFDYSCSTCQNSKYRMTTADGLYENFLCCTIQNGRVVDTEDDITKCYETATIKVGRMIAIKIEQGVAR